MAIRNYQKVPGTSASCFWLGFRSIDESSWTIHEPWYIWRFPEIGGTPQSSSILDWDFPWKPSRGSYGKRWQEIAMGSTSWPIPMAILAVPHEPWFNPGSILAGSASPFSLVFPLPMLRTKIHSSSVRTRTSYDVICYVVYECSKKCDISPSPRSCRSGSPHQLLKVFGLDRWTGTNADKVLYGYCGGWSRINRFMWFYMVLYNFHIWLQ